MFQESVSNQEQVLVLPRETALVNYKVTFVVARLVQILLRVNLEHVVTHLESNGFHFWSHIFAAVFDVAESLVGSAIESRKSLFPFGPNFLKNIRRDRELTATSVDDGRVASVFAWFLHRLVTVVHALTLKGPSA